MLVRDIMKRNVVSIRPEDSLSLAVQTMLWFGVRHLPVLHHGKLQGIISERDVLGHRATQADGDPLRDPVEKAMRAPAKYIGPDASLTEAAERMAAEKIGCLPVIMRGDLVGMITTTDLLGEQVREAFHSTPIHLPGLSAKDLMTPNPVRSVEDEHVSEAIAKMSLAGVRHLPVTDKKGTLVGFLSDRDIRLHAEELGRGRLTLKDPALRVGAIMQRQVRTVPLDTPIAALISLFGDWRLSALPVVDGTGGLAGIVSYVDVLRALTK